MSRNFCFTSFKDAEPIWDEKNYTHLLYQREIAPDTKREHWQGCCQYAKKTRKTLKTICGELGVDHVEKCLGTYQHNVNYCSKLESRVKEPKEFGVASHQGERTDISKYKDAKSMREIPFELFIKYSSGIYKYRALHAEARAHVTKCNVYWGPAGSGKSKRMPRDAYWKPPGSKWWDGYDGQENVVLDDWTEEMMPLQMMLRLCDRYPLKVETKGGYVEFIAKNIYITANSNPENWYGADSAWLRRIYWIENVA